MRPLLCSLSFLLLACNEDSELGVEMHVSDACNSTARSTRCGAALGDDEARAWGECVARLGQEEEPTIALAASLTSDVRAIREGVEILRSGGRMNEQGRFQADVEPLPGLRKVPLAIPLTFRYDPADNSVLRGSFAFTRRAPSDSPRPSVTPGTPWRPPR
jgi:hypothetical protein